MNICVLMIVVIIILMIQSQQQVEPFESNITNVPSNPNDILTVHPTTGVLGSGTPTIYQPIGSICIWYTTTIPSGWLKCDGSDIPEQYGALKELIGNKTPNMRESLPIGAGSNGQLLRQLPRTSMTKTVPIPPHGHSVVFKTRKDVTGGMKQYENTDDLPIDFYYWSLGPLSNMPGGKKKGSDAHTKDRTKHRSYNIHNAWNLYDSKNFKSEMNIPQYTEPWVDKSNVQTTTMSVIQPSIALFYIIKAV